MRSYQIRLLLAFLLCSTWFWRGVPLVGEEKPSGEQRPRSILPDEKTGIAAAVRVGDWPLVHTAQLFPVDEAGKLVGRDAAAQVEHLSARLQEVLTRAGSSWDRVVKLNFYVVDAASAQTIDGMLRQKFSGVGKHQPAVTTVITSLPLKDAFVAVDAVATTAEDPGRSVKLIASGAGQPVSDAAIIPNGTRIYVSGQAEPGDNLAKATRGTLQSLRNSLQFLGQGDQNIVQLKAFLMPMEQAEVVRKEVQDFFGERTVPPLVLVEWKSGAQMPIEIELIAWGGQNHSGPALEFIALPGLSQSPVFSRIARLNHAQSLYISGLEGNRTKSDIAAKEVKAVFASLADIVKEGGSDFRHLAKATYYVSNDEVSAQLNALRPEYYDPQRPPAASKAMVSHMPREHNGLTLDMIAVPDIDNGPPETGLGLSVQEAAAGWLCLFDGTTFGWKQAELDIGTLTKGETTSPFGNCELRADFAAGGTLFLGERKVAVPAGEFSLAETSSSESVGTIRLGQGVRLRRLMVRPLGLKSLMNGKDLTGWKRLDHPRLTEDKRPIWLADGGSIRSIGGPGCVEFQHEQFGDFVLQLDVRTNLRHANGGVFFRAIPGDFMNGYEAQVFNRMIDDNPATPAFWSTGGLDDFQNARRVVSRDGHFFRMTVIAHGSHISTWINGFQQVDFLDERPRDENPRKGRRTDAGVIQLQAHDGGTDVEFRRIEALKW